MTRRYRPPPRRTFNDLGIPFPLFEAPIDDASEYRGTGTCHICGQGDVHVFALGIGADVIAPCSACGTQIPFDADDRPTTQCPSCANVEPFPELALPLPPPAGPPDFDGGLMGCYACLRSGRAALTKDTEFGMIRWQDAIRGTTHGLPGDPKPEFETTPPNADGWRSYKMDPQHMLELTRTPAYSTWQGERWLFCCSAPMVFLGTWGLKELNATAADGDGMALFTQIAKDADQGPWDVIGGLGDAGVYAFRCQSCNKLRAHWDIS